MKSFSDIEKEFGSFTFRDEEKSGHVSLNGDTTIIKIDSDRFLHFPKDAENFFNFQTVVHGTTQVRFENAFYKIYPHLVNDRRECRAEVYANIVIINSDALSKDGALTEIQFELQGLNNHFYYKIMENCYVDREDRKFSRSLRIHQAKKQKQLASFIGVDLADASDTGGGVSEIYALRRYPKIFSFRVGNQKYECFYGYSQRGLGWQGVELKAKIFLRIVFDSPVSPQEALDSIYELRRFFSQQQMGSMSFSGIYGRSKSRKAHRFCSFYLAGEASNIKQASSDNYYSHPGSIVLNRWSQRKSLTVLLKEWLARAEQRRRYRILIDAVGDEIMEKFSLEQLASLCSAVESLEELKGGDEIGRDVVTDMTAAAKNAASKHCVDLSDDRIHGCLSLLKRKSLSHRVKLMFDAVKEHFENEDIEISLLTKSINEMRTAAVHGSSIPQDVSPRLLSTNRALHALCVIYDIVTCDSENRILSEGEGHPAARVFRDNYFQLRAINSRKK